MSKSLTIFINGELVDASGSSLCDPLISFIRNVAGLKGAKNNCAYGDTGASNVIMSSWNPAQQKFLHRTISASFVLLGSCHGTNITTIEGIGSQAKPHLLQTRLAECHGVQCGFGSPGEIVSMFGLLLQKAQPTMADVEAALVGNISRCTGYRALLEAFKVFTENPSSDLLLEFNRNLPEALKEEAKSEVLTDTDGVTWRCVPDAELKPLLKSDLMTDAHVFFGMPTPFQAKGLKNIITVSGKDLEVVHTKDGIETPASITLGALADFLGNLPAEKRSQMSQSLEKMLNSTRTVQWRSATAIGDALVDDVEIQAMLLAVGTKVVVAVRKTMAQKVCILEEIIRDIKDYVLKSLLIPLQSKSALCFFERVAPRKANAGGKFIALDATMDELTIKECKVFVAENRNALGGVGKGWGGIFEGKSIGDLSSWAGEIKNICNSRLSQNLLYKMMADLKDELEGSSSKTSEYEDKWLADPNGPIQASKFLKDGYEEAGPNSALGLNVPRVSGLAHATGQAEFIEDMPVATNELFMALVCSTEAHATIVSVDESAALALPGVKKFMSAKDIPEGANKFKILGLVDEDIFADGEVLFEGHPIGAILANTEKLARHAASLVKVQYKTRKPVVSIDDAISANSFFDMGPGFPTKWDKGDAEAVLAASESVIEGSIDTTRQEHFYEETNVVLVVPPSNADDEFKIYASTPNVILTQHTIATVLGLPFSRVHVTVKRTGCSFGGKMCRFIPLTCGAALAARTLGRPVRLHLTRDEDIRISGQRGEFRGEYKIGITKGKIDGAQYKFYNNGGWNTDCSPDVTATAMLHVDNAYAFPNMQVFGTTCKTNTASNTAFRAYGAPPGMLTTENMIYDACVELGLDHMKFRRDNFQSVGYETHYGAVMDETHLSFAKCMDEVESRCDYQNLKKKVEEFNEKNQWKKRGVYILPYKYGIATPQMFAQQGAHINVYADGSVLINHGGVESGQGLHTKMIQLVSREFGIPMSKIKVSDTNNYHVPNPIPTGGSTGADLAGNALRDACQQIKARLAPIKEANPEAPWELVVYMAFGSRINLSAAGHFAVGLDKGLGYGAGGGEKKGRRWWYFVLGAACTLVEVDILKGEHTVLSSDLTMDIGRAINPGIDTANIQAAWVQGYGLVAMENTVYSKEGKLMTRGADEYFLPTIKDCAKVLNINLLESEGRESVLYSSKGLGEPPLLNGMSVYFSIKEAVRAARTDAGLTGKFDLKLPTTPENVLEACPNSPVRPSS